MFINPKLEKIFTMVEMLITKSKVKEVVNGFNVAGDFAESLNEVLVRAVKEASQRAEGNGRKTIQARDL